MSNKVTPTITPTLPPPPNFLSAIRGGFDVIANHVWVIFLPVLLDVFLWLGPRLTMTSLIKTLLGQLEAIYRLQDPSMVEVLKEGELYWAAFAERFNLFSALRSYPIGIPSLLSAWQPLKSPLGVAFASEVTSLGGIALAWLAISVLGVVLGSVYFALVGNLALTGSANVGQTLRNLPQLLRQMLGLTLLWVLLLAAISIPGSFIVSLVALTGFSLGQCALLALAGVLMWMLFPLIFTPHAMIARHYPLFKAIKASFHLTRLTLPAATLFFMTAFLIGKGTDILWQTPVETSWMVLVGILGHAFVSTALLASSFYFYRDAVLWEQRVSQQVKLSSIKA